jgi:rhodanese-related sulfurtransferase
LSARKQKRKTRRKDSRDRYLWLIGLIAVLGLALAWVWGRNAAGSDPLPPEISVAEAAAGRDAGAFILDVREPEEWDEFHIPGATLIPLGQLAARASEVPDGKEIIVVCRSGNRSAEGREILLAAGFEQVSSMAGGMLDWQAAGYATVSGP